jgi:O-antigen/teichoic acid export membrane protein
MGSHHRKYGSIHTKKAPRVISYLGNLYRRLLSEKFMRSGLILFLGTFVSNVASYFYQFAMSRMMKPQDFGALNAVLSLFHLHTVAAGVVSLVIVKYISNFQAKQERGKLKLFVLNSLKNLGLLGSLLGIAIYVTRFWFAEFLKLDHPALLTLLAFMVFLGFIYPIGMGLLQGLQLFGRLAFAMALIGLVRLISGTIFVELGLGVSGALLANILALSVAALAAISPMLLLLKFPKQADVQRHTREILVFAVPVALAFLGGSGLLYLDLILVKHFFSPEGVGQYTAAVILGRSIFYFPGALAMAMYPMVSEAHALQKNASPILVKCLLITALFSGAGTLAFVLFPGFWIHILFGHQYPEAAGLLPYYAFSMLPLSLTHVIIQSRLAVKQYGFIPILLAVLVAECVLIVFFHKTLFQVLVILNVLQWTALLLSALYCFGIPFLKRTGLIKKDERL